MKNARQSEQQCWSTEKTNRDICVGNTFVDTAIPDSNFYWFGIKQLFPGRNVGSYSRDVYFIRHSAARYKYSQLAAPLWRIIDYYPHMVCVNFI